MVDVQSVNDNKKSLVSEGNFIPNQHTKTYLLCGDLMFMWPETLQKLPGGVKVINSVHSRCIAGCFVFAVAQVYDLYYNISYAKWPM